MTTLWDYFMRRKPILLLTLTAWVLSASAVGILVSRLTRSSVPESILLPRTGSSGELIVVEKSPSSATTRLQIPIHLPR